MAKLLAILILLLLTLPILVRAQCPGGSVCITNPLTSTTFEEFLDRLTNFLFILSLALAPLMIVIGAYYFLSAAGKPENIEKARKIIQFTIIGFMIILLSKAIVNFIKSIF